jgi:hypothetical protein
VFYELGVGEAVLFALHRIELRESRLKSRLWQIRLPKFVCGPGVLEKSHDGLAASPELAVKKRRDVALHEFTRKRLKE